MVKLCDLGVKHSVAFKVLAVITLSVATTFISLYPVVAQEILPADNGIPEISDYHTSPKYRESESHPFRVAAYIVHPIGWLLREGIFRPLSYFASSTPTRRSVMGYRDQFDFRDPYCFKDNPVPDCRSIPPLNVGGTSGEKDNNTALNVDPSATSQIFFPDINFDFDKRILSPIGKAQTRQVAELLRNQPGDLKIVLQGHTDKRGSEEYNMKLGMDRALAVRSELVRMGIDTERLSTLSFGESKPLDTAETEEAYSANRRVETKVR